eukprot:scaffold39224_cov31-Tisochrysis_lutea.AAC.4
MESILPHRYSATPVAPILSSIHSQIGQAEHVGGLSKHSLRRISAPRLAKSYHAAKHVAKVRPEWASPRERARRPSRRKRCRAVGTKAVGLISGSRSSEEGGGAASPNSIGGELSSAAQQLPLASGRRLLF